MADSNPNVVDVTSAAPKLPDGVIAAPASLASSAAIDGCRVFTHYNGPTDQLSGLCAGIAILDPGASPHPPHEHPEEEFMIVAAGTGEIECAGKTTKVAPGAMMYCAGGTLHGIKNTGTTPLTFYWSKWLANGA
jgi:mannose-6-phosphate isomerase-like protein (cupin superfamily)